jgi:hypothetical protein
LRVAGWSVTLARQGRAAGSPTMVIIDLSPSPIRAVAIFGDGTTA